MKRITQEVQRRKEIMQALRGQEWLIDELAAVRQAGKTALDECTMRMGRILAEAILYTERDRWLETAEHFWQCTSRTRRKEGKGEEPPEETKKRILDFWAWTYREQGFVESRLNDKYPTFLNRMAQLTILLDRIDEEKERWLLLCAPHVDQHHGITFFLEYLSDFEDEGSIKRVGKIYRKVLENTTPTFEQEDIQLIVEKLYKVGQNDPAVKKDADEICDTYGRRRFHFLKPIWDKYRS